MGSSRTPQPPEGADRLRLRLLVIRNCLACSGDYSWNAGPPTNSNAGMLMMLDLICLQQIFWSILDPTDATPAASLQFDSIAKYQD